ncbi:MAG: nucleoid-associated protein [Bacteroidia bacterium]
MIDFTRSTLSKFIIHFVGNKGLSEELTLSEKEVVIKDEFTKETLLRYLTSPFKTDIYYKFRKNEDVSKNQIAEISDSLFTSDKDFIKKSQIIAEHLYNQSTHPKIQGGELYVCYFKDLMVDGQLCDGIGCFKTENKETYLKVYQHVDSFELDYDNGININKLDKGALIYNIDSKKGYKLSVIDNNSRGPECALYWEEDFLGSTLKESGYFYTKNFMDASRGFCEEVLTDQNNVSKLDQMMMLNKATGYFKDKETFDIGDFEKNVLGQPELINAFSEYRHEYADKYNAPIVEEFDVSPSAVKQNNKYMKSVVKLDKNFHIYIHGRHDFVERGYDDVKGLKYYKLYFENEI